MFTKPNRNTTPFQSRGEQLSFMLSIIQKGKQPRKDSRETGPKKRGMAMGMGMESVIEGEKTYCSSDAILVCC